MYPSRTLEAALKSDVLQKGLLVTLCYGGNAEDHVPRGSRIHHATTPSAIRASTLGSSIVQIGSNRYAFWPTITSDLQITHSIDPNTLEYSPSEASVTLSSAADIPKHLLYPGGTFGMHGTVDLWAEGVNLDQVEPLLFGNVTSSKFDRAQNTATFNMTDAFTSEDVVYPSSQKVLSREIFPDMLITTSARYNRQSILGKFPYPILCPQVDSIGQLFYLCDHPLTQNPTKVFVNGEEVQGWRITSYTPPQFRSIVDDRPTAMTLIYLKEAVDLELPFVTCSGGEGYSIPKDPVTFFLEDIGGYEVSDMAKSIARQFDFELSVLNSAQGTVLEIVRDRLMKQTGYALGFVNHEAVFYSLDGTPTGITLSPSDGLRSLVEDGRGETGAQSIVNAIEIGFNRNIFTDKEIDMSKQTYYLDKDTATGELKSILKKSESIYGRRYKKLDFADVISESTTVPAHIKRTASSILTHAALQHRLVTYDCNWYPAYYIPLNGIVIINDPDENIPSRRMRLISRTISSNGIRLMFEEENVQYTS